MLFSTETQTVQAFCGEALLDLRDKGIQRQIPIINTKSSAAYLQSTSTMSAYTPMVYA